MRELDWRIHELMGNDLTGWEWDHSKEGLNNYVASYRDGSKYPDLMRIPRYSSTWEGAGLLMEWLNKQEGYAVRATLRSGFQVVTIETCLNDRVVYETVTHSTGDTFPLALAKAYISTMEERD